MDTENKTPFHRIRIQETQVGRTEITLDGEVLKGVTHIGYDHAVDGLPEVTITMYPSFALEQLCKVTVDIPVDTLDQALQCIAFYGQLDENFRKAARMKFSQLLDELPEDCTDKGAYLTDRLLEELV